MSKNERGVQFLPSSLVLVFYSSIPQSLFSAIMLHFHSDQGGKQLRPCLDQKISPKFYYKKKFPITLKCRHMHGVLNVDEIKK